MNTLKSGLLAAVMIMSIAATAQHERLSLKGGDAVYLNVQQPPQYIDNGMEGLKGFVDKNMNYPLQQRKTKFREPFTYHSS